MLRISYSQTGARQQWTLCGRLAGPWVQELRAFWQYTRQNAVEPRAVMDLSDVTFIDRSGEVLLSEMRNAGVELVATGVANLDLIENLKP
jgi:anti-anti-sigma regulatory factor